MDLTYEFISEETLGKERNATADGVRVFWPQS